VTVLEASGKPIHNSAGEVQEPQEQLMLRVQCVVCFCSWFFVPTSSEFKKSDKMSGRSETFLRNEGQIGWVDVSSEKKCL